MVEVAVVAPFAAAAAAPVGVELDGLRWRFGVSTALMACAATFMNSPCMSAVEKRMGNESHGVNCGDSNTYITL